MTTNVLANKGRKYEDNVNDWKVFESLLSPKQFNHMYIAFYIERVLFL